MCRHNHMIFPVILILVGSYFLLRNYGMLPPELQIEKLWPLILIAVGVSALMGRGGFNGASEKKDEKKD